MGAPESNLSLPGTRWRSLCTGVSFDHSRGEERHEHESTHPAPSGSLLAAPWTAHPARQHDVPIPIVGVGRPRPQDHLPDRLPGTQRQGPQRLIALDATFNSFADACTWPDHPRKRAEEHFINVGRSVHTITVAQCPAVPKCLFTAIPADLDVLRTSNDDVAKLASLKFLGHWIGDIHQPLHVSFADDRGGNFIRESGPCVNSLHTVWDTCIIEKKLGTDPCRGS